MANEQVIILLLLGILLQENREVIDSNRVKDFANGDNIGVVFVILNKDTSLGK